jgi:hypothetical protein
MFYEIIYFARLLFLLLELDSFQSLGFTMTIKPTSPDSKKLSKLSSGSSLTRVSYNLFSQSRFFSFVEKWHQLHNNVTLLQTNELPCSF